MNSDGGMVLFGAFFGAVGGIFLGLAIASHVETSVNGTPERITTENSHCARSGGRLLRGQGREFICVDPRAVKWSRAR